MEQHWLVKQAQQNPNKIVVETSQYSMTFEALFELAQRKGMALKELRRHRLGLHIDNSIESLILIHAAWLYNIEIALINNRLTEDEMIKQMQSIGVDTIITTQGLSLDASFRLFTFEDLNTTSLYPVETLQSEDQIASIMFTSGTTGVQKAVPQTFANHRASAEGCQSSLGFDESSKWLLVLPLYHISGLSIVLRSMLAGFTIYLMSKFETERTLDVIKNQYITHASLVPVTLKRLMKNGLTEPFHLKKILLGGAKLSHQFIQQGLEYHLPIYNSFGMTETCSQFLTASPEMLKSHKDTVGKASDNQAIKIVNVNDEGHGELCVKGVNVMNGYLFPANIDDQVFDDEGYFHTGDIASINEEGYVTIYDRRKDLIISGGENIYPNEIENVAKTHPLVNDAMCIGVKDETWGQRPFLYIVADDACTNLLQFLSKRLAKYKLPIAIQQIESLPYTSTGKLKRQFIAGEWT